MSRWVHDDWIPFEMPPTKPLGLVDRLDLPSAASAPLMGQPIEDPVTMAETGTYAWYDWFFDEYYPDRA